MSESIDPGMETSAPRLPAQPPQAAQTPQTQPEERTYQATQEPPHVDVELLRLEELSPPPSQAVADVVQSLEGRLKQSISSKLFLAFVALFLVLEAFFNSGDNRNNAVEFLEDEIKTPIAALTPFKIIDVFGDEVSDCSKAYLGERCSTRLDKVPAGLVNMVDYVVSQGVVGILFIGLPAAVLLLGALSELADKRTDTNLLMVIHPGYWIGILLFIALAAWVLQLGALALLFVVKQTILAFAVIGAALFVYDRFELWSKVQQTAQSWFKGA